MFTISGWFLLRQKTLTWVRYHLLLFVVSCFTCTSLTFPLITVQNLKDVLIGGKSGSNFSVTPLLLFSGRTGTETRLPQHLCSLLTLTIVQAVSSDNFCSLSQDSHIMFQVHLCSPHRPRSSVSWSSSWMLSCIRSILSPLCWSWTPYGLCLPWHSAYPPARPYWQQSSNPQPPLSSPSVAGAPWFQCIKESCPCPLLC